MCVSVCVSVSVCLCLSVCVCLYVCMYVCMLAVKPAEGEIRLVDDWIPTAERGEVRLGGCVLVCFGGV